MTTSTFVWFFSSFKIHKMFGVKDPIPCELLTSFYARAVMPAMSAKPLDIYPQANVSTWSALGLLTF